VGQGGARRRCAPGHRKDSKVDATTYDYTRPGTFPRSGRETLGGVVYLARAIDKVRADLAGTVGEYIAACPQSRQVYDLFGVTPEQFREAVSHNPKDESVLLWLQEHGQRQPSKADIERFDAAMLAEGPSLGNARAMGYLRHTLEEAGQSHRTDVRTYVDMQDLEEGRPVPQRI
jgi:hypothetical protein